MPMPSVLAWAGLAWRHRLALPEHLRLRSVDHAVDDLHQRRLAGAVLAEHGVDLAGHDGEIDAVVGDDRRIDLADAAHFEPRRLPSRAGHGYGVVIDSPRRSSRIVVVPARVHARRRMSRLARQPPAAAHLQHLGGDRDGDHLGLLAADAGDPIGTRHRSRGSHAAFHALPAAFRTGAASTRSRSGRSRRNRRGQGCAPPTPRPADGCASSRESTHRRGAAATSASGVSVTTHVDVVRHRRRERHRRASRPNGRGTAMSAERAHDRAADVARAEQHDGKIGHAHDVDEHLESPPAPPSVARPGAPSPARSARRERRGLAVVDRRAQRADVGSRRHDQAACRALAAHRHDDRAIDAVRAQSSDGIEPAASPHTGSNRSCASPPQHCPRLAPSGKRCRATAARGAAMRSRAMAIALCSRCPPPIVPSIVVRASRSSACPAGAAPSLSRATTLTSDRRRPLPPAPRRSERPHASSRSSRLAPCGARRRARR